VVTDIPAVNGIPQLGFGTFPLKGVDCESAVRMALEVGIRHVDTAQMYGNEAEVGRAVTASGIARKDIYVVTKVDPGNVGKDRFAESVARSMEVLGGPADLLLIHWPPEGPDFDGALDRLMAEKRKGMARAIGISNFSTGQMRRAQARCGGELINNQVEFQPLFDQSKVLAAARNLGIAVSAYSPLARGKALQPQVIQDIAARLQRPPSEIVLRWIIQQGVIAIPMTTKRDNALSNLRALTFSLSEADMVAITAIGTREGRTISPAWMKGKWEE
jgi:diketogulonate reductase-like aldo/keto reductase